MKTAFKSYKDTINLVCESITLKINQKVSISLLPYVLQIPDHNSHRVAKRSSHELTTIKLSTIPYIELATKFIVTGTIDNILEGYLNNNKIFEFGSGVDIDTGLTEGQYKGSIHNSDNLKLVIVQDYVDNNNWCSSNNVKITFYYE